MFDQLSSARSLLDEVGVGFDASALSPEAALRCAQELGAIRRAVDGMTAKAAKRVSETSVGASSGVAIVARTLGVHGGEVRAAIETATRLESLPATDQAVRQGRLSGRETQLISEAAIVNPAAEEELLAKADEGLVHLREACIRARAAVEDPDERAARQKRQRRWSMRSDGDGMFGGAHRWTPEVGGAIKAAIDAQVQRIFRAAKAGTDHESLDAYAADAVAQLILRDDSIGVVHGPQYTVHVVVDHGALMRGGTVDGEVCEIPGVGPVDVSWVKELLGSAFLTAVVRKGKDILTVGHLGRHVPVEILTALVVSGRECDIDRCDHRGYLERDHRHDHSKGGLTSYLNLGWLCYRHHRLKSSGWILGPPRARTRKRTLEPPRARAA